MCQEMPTELYTRWKLDTDSQKVWARTNRSRTFENMPLSYLQSQCSECKNESYYTTGKQKKIDCFSVDGFCAYCTTMFESMGWYFHFCPCQEAKASLSEEETHRGIRKRENDESRRDYLKSKGWKNIEIWECKWWESVKEEENFRNHVKKNCAFKQPLKKESFLAKMRDGEMFGYVQCDLEVPAGLKYKFSNFRPILKNFNVSPADIGDYMRENNLLKRPQRLIFSSFNLENGTVITLLLNFYLSRGLKCTTKSWFQRCCWDFKIIG